jgi:hypothetical protein
VSDVFPLSLSSFVRRCPLVEKMTGHGDWDTWYRLTEEYCRGKGRIRLRCEQHPSEARY